MSCLQTDLQEASKLHLLEQEEKLKRRLSSLYASGSHCTPTGRASLSLDSRTYNIPDGELELRF